MPQNFVSLQYLQTVAEDLTKQAEQHYANWQATLGALDLLKHLVEVAQSEPQPEPQAIELAPYMGGIMPCTVKEG